ncbi:hypothetical protein H0H92_005897 [Tricholoma furcatifolium]|nr:hypothetical protein H0H92_005897 [Tricholoma furcatifolium]
MTDLRLPDELLILIFRHATNVPEALDTSYEFIAQENRNEVLRLVDDSMRTKLVLSVVSKHFHALTDDLLYELIIVRSFSQVPHLSRLLRSSPPHALLPRGHSCRRLDFYFGCPGTPRVPHDWDDAWDVGVHVLWGILPPCTQLEILILRAGAPKRRNCRRGFCPALPECTTRAGLWKTLTATCGRALRRLEVLGVAVHADRLELMLRYMPNVEVCTIGNNVEFVDGRASKLQRARRKKGSPMDVYDEDPPYDDPEDYPHYLYRCRDPPPEVATWFGEETLAGLRDTRKSVVWPPYTGDAPPYLIPKLHTMFLAQLKERIFEFRLPALRTLGIAELHSYWRVFLHTSLTREIKANEDSTLHCQPHCEGWYTIDTVSEESAPYFRNPVPHSTPFGLFPTSITQLYVPRVLPLSRILYFFPNLRHRAWVAYGIFCPPERPDNVLPFYERHKALHEVSFFEYRHAYPRCREPLRELIDAVQDGWVVRLKCVHIIDDRVEMDRMPLMMSFMVTVAPQLY